MGHLNRRHFLASAAAAISHPAGHAAVTVDLVRARSPYDTLLRDIEPGHDDFPQEKIAFDIASNLKQLLATRALPLAPGFHGISPNPMSYERIADDVSSAVFNPADTDFEAGLKRWLDSLGPVRASRFFVLPDDLVRFEIAAAGNYRTGHWKQRWADGKLLTFEPLEEIVTTSPEPLFLDATAQCFRGVDSFSAQLSRGVPYWRARLDAASGIDVHGHNGIAVGDIDADGRDEIYVCQPAGLPNRLYKVRPDGLFEDITDAAGVGVLDATSSALFVDFRNTGRQDLVVLRPEGPLLFLNQGGNHFTVKPGAFRFRTAPQGSFTGMAAADYDRDGRVDLYLCTYSFFRDQGQYRYPLPYYDARNGPANFLFRNELNPDGTGAFTDVTEAAGLNQNNDRFSFAPAWCDYNGDGWPDLYVANDFGRKNLYRNEGGTFRDVAAEAGVEDIGDGMSAAWFDYDGDGQPDLYVANMWSDAGQRVVAAKNLQPAEAWKRHAKGNSLFRNLGNGTFEETGAAEGVEMGRWAWSSDGIDFDNDGTPEIFITTGMLTNESETDLESFFWRKIAAAPKNSYENGWNALGQAVHEKFSEAGRQTNVFYSRRAGRYRDFSGVSGLDVAEDSRAFAVLDIDGDGRLDLLLKSRLGPQVRVFRNNCAGDRASIQFRLRGIRSNRDGIGARVEVDGQAKFLNAGSGYLSQHTKTLAFGLRAQDSAKLVTILWPSGERQQFENLKAGFTYDVQEGSATISARAFLTPLAVAEETVVGDNKPVFSDTWLLDPVLLPEPAPAGVLKIDESLTPVRAQLYAVFCRYLFDLRADLKLPVWFLVDDRNRALRVSFTAPNLAARPAPLPFQGTWYSPPKRSLSALGAALFAAGFPEQALRYLEQSPQNNPQILFAIGKIHLSASRWSAARAYLEKGLALAPDSADGWNNLGAVEVGEGNLRDALQHFSKAIALKPDMSSALINAGQAHAALGNPHEAEQLFRHALQLNPADAVAANQLGELFVLQHRDTEARDWFQRAIGARRDYAPAIGNLGILYTRRGQLTDAVAAFRYGIEVAPDEASFYLNLSAVYRSQGDAQAARDVLQLLLTHQPANESAKQALRHVDSPHDSGK